MRSHRRLGAVVAALAAVILLAGPASAAQWQFVFKESGTSAFAEADFTCTDNSDGTTTCEGTFLDVFAGKSKELGTSTVHSERVCYNQFSETFNSTTGDFIETAGVFGCAFDAGTLSIDNLTSITLAETEISLTQFECDIDSCTESPDGTVVVEGTWTGVGPIGSQKSKFRFDDGTCVQADASKGSFREASFSGTVDGDPFTAASASMGQGTFMFRTTCGLL
jgi:hypothetical protein